MEHTGKKNSKQTQELWLCLRFTHLSLNSLNIAADSDLAQAVSYQQKIWQHNRIAHDSGIKKGINVSHALTIKPDLILHTREPHKEAKKYQDLSYWAYRFSSLVSAYSEDSLLLEVGRSIKLFNNLKNIVNAINHNLNNFKISHKTGMGNTPKAAYAMSFNSPDTTLENCALACLELSPNTLKQLQSCGFKFLSDITDIAKPELGQRFGADFLVYLRQLHGSLADPQTAITPPKTFYSHVDFAEPIDNLLWIQQELDKLLARLADFIDQRQLVCHCFSWTFHCNNPINKNSSQAQTVDIALSTKQNDLHTLQSLSQLKLSNIKLNWEFSSIELRATELSPKNLFNNDLFNPKTDHEAFQQLLDRLSARLGNKAIFGIHAKPEALPELANGQHLRPEQLRPEQRVQEEQPAAVYCEAYTAKPQLLKDQPLSLLKQPKKLTQHAKQPYFKGPLTIIHGPDRFSSHWWENTQNRDYFIARRHSGHLLWIFYDQEQKNWFLHGLFS